MTLNKLQAAYSKDTEQLRVDRLKDIRDILAAECAKKLVRDADGHIICHVVSHTPQRPPQQVNINLTDIDNQLIDKKWSLKELQVKTLEV